MPSIINGQNLAITIIAAATALVILTLAWVIIIRFIRYQKKKRAELIHLAAELGLQLIDEKPPQKTFEPKPEHAAQLSMKKSRYRLLFAGLLNHTGPAARIFQHEYVVSTGQSNFTVRHRIATIDIPPDWPTTRICSRRKGKMKFDIWKKKKPLTLESKEFNRRFIVKSIDSGFALLLADPSLQAALLRIPKGIALAFHLENGKLYYLEKGSLNSNSIRALLDRLQLFCTSVPAELWDRNSHFRNE